MIISFLSATVKQTLINSKILKLKACLINHLLAHLALANSNKFKNESKI